MRRDQAADPKIDTDAWANVTYLVARTMDAVIGDAAGILVEPRASDAVR